MDLPITVNSSKFADHQQRRRHRQSWIRVAHYTYIQCIPVIIFVCFFILWWFSYRVHVVVKDGQITEIRGDGDTFVTMTNQSGVDLEILKSSSSSVVGSAAAASDVLNSSVSDTSTSGKDISAGTVSQRNNDRIDQVEEEPTENLRSVMDDETGIQGVVGDSEEALNQRME